MNTHREFIKQIGNPYWMKKRQQKTPYVRMVYCEDCLTDHEVNKHRKGVR